jgi:hypothetical protein
MAAIVSTTFQRSTVALVYNLLSVIICNLQYKESELAHEEEEEVVILIFFGSVSVWPVFGENKQNGENTVCLCSLSRQYLPTEVSSKRSTDQSSPFPSEEEAAQFIASSMEL